MVIVVGGLVGWYFFRGGSKLPGMKIGTEAVTPAPTTTEPSGVTISDEPTGTGTSKGGVGTESGVTYTDNGFQPSELRIKAGSTVVFTNASTGSMWVASNMHPTHQLLPGFDQKRSVEKGGTYEYTFTKVGTWKYHNHVKPEVTATVIVTQ